MNSWISWVGPFADEALFTLAVLPIVACTLWAVVHRRQRAGTAPAQAWRTSLAEVGIIYGTLPFLWIAMLPGSRPGAGSGQLSLVPLRDLATMSDGQVVGNLLVFAALGFFAPLRFPALASVARVTVVACAGSVLIETAQSVLRLDRVSSIDDVLLNAAGAGLAALASRRWWRARRGSVGAARRLAHHAGT